MEGGENNVIISMRCGQRDIEFNLVRPGPEYLPLYEKTFRMVYMANRIIVKLLDVNEGGGSMEYRCRSLVSPELCQHPAVQRAARVHRLAPRPGAVRAAARQV